MKTMNYKEMIDTEKSLERAKQITTIKEGYDWFYDSLFGDCKKARNTMANIDYACEVLGKSEKEAFILTTTPILNLLERLSDKQKQKISEKVINFMSFDIE